MNVTSTATSLEAVLYDEWNDHLAHATHDYGAIGILTGEELLELVQRPQPVDDRDQILITLLELDRSGHAQAGRVLLQAFLPLAIRQARTSGATNELWKHSRADAVATQISALWEVIHTFPLHRRSSVAGNIRKEALKILHSSLGHHVGKEFTVSEGFLEHLVNQDAEVQDDAFRDLVTIFTWAIEAGILSRDEIKLLARIELADEDPGAVREAAAEELGVSRETLNRRIHRIRTKLMTAVSGDVQNRVRYAPRRKA